jgi:NADH:ubiquinone oxidoreductase subunit 3 (subunit A)
MFLVLYVSFTLIILLILLSYLISPSYLDFEKISSYECGFEPYSSAREQFKIQYFIVSIIFMLFEVEIIFLLP